MKMPAGETRRWIQLLDPSLLIAIGSVVAVLLTIELLGRAGWIQTPMASLDRGSAAQSAAWVQQRELSNLCDGRSIPLPEPSCTRAQGVSSLRGSLHAEAASMSRPQ